MTGRFPVSAKSWNSRVGCCFPRAQPCLSINTIADLSRICASVFPLRWQTGLSLVSEWTNQGPLAASEQVHRVLEKLSWCLFAACSVGSQRDLNIQSHIFYEQWKYCPVTLSCVVFCHVYFGGQSRERTITEFLNFANPKFYLKQNLEESCKYYISNDVHAFYT